jgi:DNA-binding transcriptional MerR regulator
LTVIIVTVMTKWLDHLKNARFHGVKELADAAEELLREIGPSQDKGTVAEYPNERTIRYYLSENLLPEPLGKAGSASIFGYEHLVTLAAIKKLQSQGLPINVIKGVIEGRSTEQLESLLESDESAGVQNSPLRASAPAQIHDDLGDVQFSALDLGPPPRSEAPQNAAKSFLESILFSRHSPQPASEVQLSRFDDSEDMPSLARLPSLAEPPEEPTNKWVRHEIEPGLELHIREGYSPVSGWRKAIKAIETILKRASGK